MIDAELNETMRRKSAAEARVRELEAKLAEKEAAVRMYSEEQQRLRDRVIELEAEILRGVH